MDELLTVKDVAALLRVSVPWVYQRGVSLIPAVHIGSNIRFRASDVERLIKKSLDIHSAKTGNPDDS